MGSKSCEFFKVYLSHTSSKQLGLPPAFVLQFGGKVPSNCTIKDPSGKIWKVKLKVSNVGLVVVGNGWQEFACHHSLVDGDFLVFDYDGDSRFGVKIYGINGLRKRRALDIACASTNPVKRQRRQGVEAMRLSSYNLPTRPRPLGIQPRRGTLNQTRARAMPSKAKETANNFAPKYPYFKAVMRPSTLANELFVPGKFVMDHIKPMMEHGEQRAKLPETKLLTADGKWRVTLNVNFKSCTKGKLQAGWPKFVRENCLLVGDECFFELINNKPVIMKVSIFKHNGDEHASGKLNQSRSLVVPYKAEEEASNFTSSYPYFKTVMCPSKLVSSLSVPRNFVMDHIKPKMELHAKQRVKKAIETKLLAVHGEWSVGLNVYFKRGGVAKLSAGWRKFVRDNCLEVGDECFFELINNDPVIIKFSVSKHRG